MTETTTKCGVEFIPHDTTIPTFTCTRTEGGWFPDIHRTDTHWFFALPGTGSFYYFNARCCRCRHRTFRKGCLCPTDGCRCQPGIHFVKPRKPRWRRRMTVTRLTIIRICFVICVAGLTGYVLARPALTPWVAMSIACFLGGAISASVYVRRSRP